MPPRLNRTRRGAVLVVALATTVAVVVVAMAEKAMGYQGADTAIRAVADVQNVQRQIHELQQERGRAILHAAEAGQAPPTAEFEDYTDRIALLSQRITGVDRVGDPALHEGLRALEKLALLKESTAQERGLLGGVFAAGEFTAQEHWRFAAVRAIKQDRLADFERMATEDQRARLRAALDSPNAREAAGYEQVALADAGARLQRPVDASRWWAVMTTVIDELRMAQQALADDLTRQAHRLRAADLRDLLLCLVFGALGGAAQVGLFLRRDRLDRAGVAFVSEFGTTLMTTRCADDAWNLLARRAGELFASHVLILRTAWSTQRFRACTRVGTEELELLRPAIESSCVADVLSTGVPVLLDDFCDHLRVPDCSLGPAAAVPVRVGSRVLGVLLAVRDSGAARFTTRQVADLITLADDAAVAIDVAEAHEARRWSDVVDDRARIAQRLYHDVVHRLVGVGMSLQGMIGLTPQAHVRARMHAAINQLDETVRRLREAVFDLHPTHSEPTLRQRLLHAANELVQGTDITLTVGMSGCVDTWAQPELTAEAEAVIRATVGNVVRHAQATELVVTVEMTDVLSVEVRDDGPPSATVAGQGVLVDLAWRAANLGGVLSAAADPAGGTLVSWRVPWLRDHEAEPAP
ncbi:GAF domain-containing protein [Lentzea sp. NEAU-D13]|uniref:GAF domain-containing protein n=1 Tax=Lentzea alba TaxID=2714351 RepID=A0A7C9VVB1_9PSEU|nr:nitrate- and nitrite sensing domain-containing protein [Lentzea alba]NGY63215.1 GAF domain-containing protein [Lentzea alba]